MDSNNKAHAAPAVISEERLRALAAVWLVGTENREREAGYVRGVNFALVKCADDLLALIGTSAEGGIGITPDGDVSPRPMATAPRDGTTVRLLVQFSDHSTEDTQGPAWTIGHCSKPHPEDDDNWQFAGWCWSHDHFTEGKGEPVGWLPLIDASTNGDATTARIAALEAQVIELDRLCDSTYVAQGADAYNHACEMLEQFQAAREAAGKEVGTEGSLCDGMAWLYGRLAELEAVIDTSPKGSSEAVKRLHQRADEIEAAVAMGKMDAPQCFTQMRQLLPARGTGIDAAMQATSAEVKS